LTNPTTRKIKEYCEITSSKRIYAADYQEEGVPFFRGKEIVEQFNGISDFSTKLFISQNKYEEIKNRFGIPKRGDILLTSVGTLGIPFLVTDDDAFYFKDGNITWFKDIHDLNSKYLYYWLLSPLGKAQLQKCSIGTSQSAYTIIKLKEMDIATPDIITQSHIADILSAYDDLIENNRRRIKLLEQSARLLFKEWFVYLRFPGHEHVKITDGVPDGWEKKRLENVAKLNYGKALKADDRIPGPFPVYGSSGVVGSHEKPLVKGPGIIVGRKGSVGSIYWSYNDFFPIDTVYYINQTSATFYLYYVLLHIHFINTDGTVPGLNRDFAHSREIILPKKELLSLFNEIVTPIHDQIFLLQNYCRVLERGRVR
jgi:type I restriction enzyme S subunit